MAKVSRKTAGTGGNGKNDALPATIGDLAPDPANPRRIDEPSENALRTSISEFGDLGTICFNLRTRQLVAGHQRVRQIVRQYGSNLSIKPPLGKTDRGWIECPNGDLFAVRFVDWDLAKQRTANVAANSPLLSGEFTEDLRAIVDAAEADDGILASLLRFDELLDGQTVNGEKTQLVHIPFDKPPEMTWALIGMPTVRWGEIAELIEQVAKIPETVVETTVTYK